jgi:hypothetical protein
MVYNYHDKVGFKGGVLTNYDWIRRFPIISKYCISELFDKSPEFVDGRIRNTKARYLLLIKDSSVKDDIVRYIAGEIARKRFREIPAPKQNERGEQIIFLEIMDAPK